MAAGDTPSVRTGLTYPAGPSACEFRAFHHTIVQRSNNGAAFQIGAPCGHPAFTISWLESHSDSKRWTGGGMEKFVKTGSLPSKSHVVFRQPPSTELRKTRCLEAAAGRVSAAFAFHGEQTPSASFEAR